MRDRPTKTHTQSHDKEKREFIFHIAKTLNKYTTEMQNQEGCQKGTWPIKARRKNTTNAHKIVKYVM